MRDETAHRHPPQVRAAARELRKPQTPAEQKVWALIRDRQLGGLKFRRQQPLGRFIADFYCASCHLVVELDGDSHAEQAEYDATRTEWLQQQGYRVVRFTNREVENELAAVLQAILRECGKS